MVVDVALRGCCTAWAMGNGQWASQQATPAAVVAWPHPTHLDLHGCLCGCSDRVVHLQAAGALRNAVQQANTHLTTAAGHIREHYLPSRQSAGRMVGRVIVLGYWLW